MTAKTPLEQLKIAFPIFTIKNKMHYSNSIQAFDGESILFPPMGTRKVASSMIHNIPDPVIFQIIEPSVDDLIKFGVIKKPTTVVSSTQLNKDDAKGDK